MSDFPRSPDELDAAWLSKAVGHKVTDFEVEYFSEGTGVIGQVTRINLKSRRPPRSVIAKFPSAVVDNRAVAEAYHMYGREVHFYRDIAPLLAMSTPHCYFAAFDPATHNFVLVLEDLRDMRIGDQVAGCTFEEARAVVDTLAKMHASAWEPTELDIMSHNSAMQRDGMIGGFRLGWPVVREEFGDLIPVSAAHVGEAMPNAIGWLLETMCSDPVCFTHADVRLDNIFFGKDNEVVFVDWQSICTSAPEQDLAYFLTQSVPPEVRAEQDLIRRYHSRLTRLGIDYDLERCRERFRISALYLLCYAVVIAGTLDMGNERGRALARTLLGNSLTALDEMDAFELLDNAPTK